METSPSLPPSAEQQEAERHERNKARFLRTLDPEVKRTLVETSQLFDKYGYHEFYIYGSRARGRVGKERDVDLCFVIPDEEEEHWKFERKDNYQAKFKEELLKRGVPLENLDIHGYVEGGLHMIYLTKSHFDDKRSSLARSVKRDGLKFSTSEFPRPPRKLNFAGLKDAIKRLGRAI